MKYILTALLIALLISCSESGTEHNFMTYEEIVDIEGYLPLEVGNWWEYADGERITILDGPIKVSPEWMDQYGFLAHTDLPMYKAEFRVNAKETNPQRLYIVKGEINYYIITPKDLFIHIKAVLPYDLKPGIHTTDEYMIEVDVSKYGNPEIVEYNIDYKTYSNLETIDNGYLKIRENIGIAYLDPWYNLLDYHLE